MVPGELGLGVERVDLADAAVHEKHDARLGLGGELRLFGRHGAGGGRFGFGSGRRSCEKAVFRQEGGERRADEAAGRFPEELAAGAAAGCQQPDGGSLVGGVSVHGYRSPAKVSGFASIAVDELIRIQDDQAECLECLAAGVSGPARRFLASGRLGLDLLFLGFEELEGGLRLVGARGPRQRQSERSFNLIFWYGACFGEQPRCEVAGLFVDE